MGYYNWDSKDFRDGWYARKRKEKKQRPLWILLGFCFGAFTHLTVWTLFHT